uniref:Uncharacterized protein n=1 Tax=Acrobeloides nanus TaxID=290746 RepID=A0A914EFC9_9BILA
MKYENDSSVAVVYGYNSTFTLFEFNKTTVLQYDGIGIIGTLISLIIPPGSMLIGDYYSLLYETSQHSVTPNVVGGDTFVDVNMTPNYPNWVEANNFTMSYRYIVAYASIALKIVAEVPQQCLFLITDGQQQTFADSSKELFINKTIRFNATYFEIHFIGIYHN